MTASTTTGTSRPIPDWIADAHPTVAAFFAGLGGEPLQSSFALDDFCFRLPVAHGHAGDHFVQTMELRAHGIYNADVYAAKNATLPLSLDVSMAIDAPRMVALGDVLAAMEVSPRRVLDVGCGNGLLTCLLATLWPRAEVYGVDRCPEAIANAKAIAERCGLDNVSFVVSDFADHEGDDALGPGPDDDHDYDPWLPADPAHMMLRMNEEAGRAAAIEHGASLGFDAASLGIFDLVVASLVVRPDDAALYTTDEDLHAADEALEAAELTELAALPAHHERIRGRLQRIRHLLDIPGRLLLLERLPQADWWRPWLGTCAAAGLQVDLGDSTILRYHEAGRAQHMPLFALRAEPRAELPDAGDWAAFVQAAEDQMQ